MDHSKLLTSNDIPSILCALGGRAGDRRLRLYLCAGCRQISHLFYREESTSAIEVAERYVENEATIEELSKAAYAAESPTLGYELIGPKSSSLRPGIAPRLLSMGLISADELCQNSWSLKEGVVHRLLAAAYLAYYCVSDPLYTPDKYKWSGWQGELFSQVDWPGPWLAQCVFGDIVFDRDYSVNHYSLFVVEAATSAYKERLPSGMLDPAKLKSLSDALTKEGRGNDDLAMHVSDTHQHVRGCWAIDMIKESIR